MAGMYYKLAKAVHPDHLNDPNATKMMMAVNALKNNDGVLGLLAETLGFVFDRNMDRFIRKNVNTGGSVNDKKVELLPAVGVIIDTYNKDKGHRVYGPIIGVNLIESGSLSGGKEFVIYNTLSTGIEFLQTFSFNPFEKIVRKATHDEMSQGWVVYKHLKTLKNNEEKDNINLRFQKFGLYSNQKYLNIKGRIYTNKSAFDAIVTKTTAKMVFYKRRTNFETYGDEKRLHITKIHDIVWEN